MHVDLVLGLQVLQVARVVVHRRPPVRRAGGLDAVLQDGLQVLRNRVPLGLVEDDLEELHRLVVAAEHVVLDHVLRAEAHVRRRIVELEGVDDALFERRHDFAAGQLRHFGAHLLEQVRGQTDGAVLEALQLGSVLDRLLEPAERLRRHRHGEKADDVEIELGQQLVIERETAAAVDPRQRLLRVGAVDRAGAEERRDLALPVPVHGHVVAGIEHALAHGVHDLERLHDRAGQQIVDAQPPAGHLVDALHVFLGHLVEDVLRAPHTLHLQHDRRLRHGNHRETRDCGTGAGGARRSGTCAARV